MRHGVLFLLGLSACSIVKKSLMSVLMAAATSRGPLRQSSPSNVWKSWSVPERELRKKETWGSPPNCSMPTWGRRQDSPWNSMMTSRHHKTFSITGPFLRHRSQMNSTQKRPEMRNFCLLMRSFVCCQPEEGVEQHPSYRWTCKFYFTIYRATGPHKRIGGHNCNGINM